MKRAWHDTVWDVVKYVFLVFSVLCVLFPLYIAVANSLKSDQDYINLGILQFPSHPAWSNYVTAWTGGALGNAFFNTFTIIVLAVIGNVLLGTMVAYVLGRFEFPLKRLVLGAYVFVMFIPTITTQVATFGIVKNLGLFDTRWSMVLLYLGASAVQIFIYLQFIRQIPVSLDEAAMLEGASYFRIYRSVILPLLTPASVTVAILQTIAIYNDLYSPYLYMPSVNLGVVSTALLRFQGPYSAQWNLILAASIIIAIPAVLLYLFLQRYIFAGIVNGAVRE
ncbi:sugar ABC transporter permease [Alicyclobacillus cellulosilyticus]|uniref:Sugar ABC transporter permease n=1 Tax=Alicyclobacillus cellulosilyticus TaxID=1003997 RepID=A0A917NIG1_9BACL|nr:carbohydrate ABC transporter permease [Alicyclobacillus cellulosilyticus]GGJ00330.1 sugar ABC transporter permease [Alicyclobacillus cellulosilyticus]